MRLFNSYQPFNNKQIKDKILRLHIWAVDYQKLNENNDCEYYNCKNYYGSLDIDYGKAIELNKIALTIQKLRQLGFSL
jgi:hypothetical protein